MKGVVLDSAFDSGDTILGLQKRKLGYTVPLRRKGSGANRRNACFAWAHGRLGTVKWTTETTRRAVSVRVLVWRLAGKKRSGPVGEPATKWERSRQRQRQAEAADRMRVFAFGGWGDAKAVAEFRRARLARRRDRERFAIETSYRQKNRTRAWTTSRDFAYRLLLEGIAHLLRQVWVLVTEAIARSRKLRPTDWVGDFTVADLAEWIAEILAQQYPAERSIPLAGKTINSTEAA